MSFAAAKLFPEPAVAVGAMHELAVGPAGNLIERLATVHAAYPLEAVYYSAMRVGRRGPRAAERELLDWCAGQGVPARPVERTTYAKAFGGNAKATGAELVQTAHLREIMVEDEASAEAVAIFHSVFAAA